jgi:hypothetical protein
MIPKIVTGSGISGALAYVMGQGNDAQTNERLILKDGEQSRATILGGQNFGFEIETAADVELARRIMEFQGLPQNQASKTRKLDNDCYHASLSWGLGQNPTDEEMLQAGHEFLKAVGLEKARAVFVKHDDHDHKHMHVVASRIDPETGRSLRMDYDKKAAQKWALQWEREHGQERKPELGKNLHALIDAIEKHDPQAVLSHITRDKATFQGWEVSRALAYGDLTADAKAAFKTEILSQKNIIGLSDTRDEAVSRYTTVEALAPEMALRETAGRLAKDKHHGIDAEIAPANGFTPQPPEGFVRVYRGIGENVGEAQAGEPVFFSTDRATASVYGVVHYADVTREEFAKCEHPENSVVPIHENDLRTSNPEIISRLQPLPPDTLAQAKDHKATVAERFTLNGEQTDALRHLTGKQGFAILWGEAGTGKSHTLKATRAAYEAEGKDVIGLSWKNDVVQQMRDDGFSKANTIASEFIALEKGRTKWTRDTVLVVDEAAMVATEHLARLMAYAKDAGAKVILAGDDKQLGAIDRGGMFEVLREEHGAAILKEVQRNRDEAQQWNEMHEGKFRPALAKADQAGNVHWTKRQSDTFKEMAARYDADVQATPDKKRFMFAYTNADVDTLNQHARELHKARGDLGTDCTLKTATGQQQFATGDRIQFTGTGYGKEAKQAGLVNGRVGTVAGIDFTEGGAWRVTVDLDTAKNSQRVSFIVGEDARAGQFDKFKLGYAGTVYKSQGRTLDEVYIAHSPLMRSAAAYVALTRHREAVHIFAARETVKDLDAMARGMARPDNKRAASAYVIDEKSADRAELQKAVAEYSTPPIVAAIDNAQNVNASRTAEPLMSSGAQPEATSTHQLDEGKHGAEPKSEIAATTESAVAAALDAVANVAMKPVEILSSIVESLLGGGSSAPAPKAPEAPKRKSRSAKLKEFREREQQQRQAAIQALAQSIGASEAMTPEELQREKEAQEKRSRDRGGGQSL